jgi:predicted amidohydrolase YtcJ
MSARAELLVSGRIATLEGDADRGFGWVEAVAIAGGRVIAAGTRGDVEGQAGSGTRRVDLEPGEVAIPGLTDAHLHLAQVALNADAVELAGAASLDEGLALIAAAHHALADDRWLQGAGWLADHWAGWPTAGNLERVAPGRPAALWAHDHHALWANTTALRLAGVDATTADPPGGAIRRDAGGQPTGILHEAAARLVTSQIPPPTADELVAAIPAVARELLSLGVTGIQDPGALSMVVGLGPAFEAYRRLAADRELGIRVHASIREEQLAAAIEAGYRSGEAMPGGDDGDRLRFGWLKLFADGTLGSRTAAMLEPFVAEPDGSRGPGDGLGIWMTEPARLAELAGRAADAGIACQIHAIGDQAVRAALDALTPIAEAMRPVMPRIEHVQLAAAADVPRFAALGIAASVQPIHLRSDATAARRLWGARAERDGYRLRSLVDAGALVAFGTDAPVEPLDPWPGLEIAITRHSPSWPTGTPVFGESESLGIVQAIRAATVSPPMSTGCPDRGRLTPGSVADLAIIPAEAVDTPVESGGPLGRTRPRLVIAGGEVAFER